MNSNNRESPFTIPKIVTALMQNAISNLDVLGISNYKSLLQVSTLVYTHGSSLLFDHLNAHISINLYDEGFAFPFHNNKAKVYRKLVLGGYEQNPMTPISNPIQNLLKLLGQHIREIEIWNPVQCIYSLLRYPDILKSFELSLTSLKLMLDPMLERDEDFYEKLCVNLIEFIQPLENLKKIEVFNGAKWNPPPCHEQLLKFLLNELPLNCSADCKIIFTESLNIPTQFQLLQKVIGRDPQKVAFQNLTLTITDEEESGRDLLPQLLENLSRFTHGLYLVTVFKAFEFPVPETWVNLNYLTLINWGSSLCFLKRLPSLKYLELDKLDVKEAVFKNNGTPEESNFQKFQNVFTGLNKVKEVKIISPKYDEDITSEMKFWLISTFELSQIN